MSENEDSLEGPALVTQAVAEEIVGILLERSQQIEGHPFDWTPVSAVGALIAAAWRASQTTLRPMPPEIYVNIVRRHADAVEASHG